MAWRIPSLTTATYEQSAYRFFANNNSTDVGSALDVQNTPVTLVNSGDAFRLRMLIHVAGVNLPQSGQSFKLQFVDKGTGTCANPTGGTPSTYTDITAATAIAYNNNSTPTDGAALTTNANDPTHSGDTIVNQTYEELNNFTNSQAIIPSGQDGKWDFSLIDNGAPANTSYCFRAVKSDDSTLNTYSVIAEITTAAGVSQTLTFSISDNTIGFGTLVSSGARYATGDTLGSDSNSADAHTLSASTNAGNGYTITLSGTTLAFGAHSIDAIGGTNTASSPGAEQFGLRLTVNSGNGTVSAPYATLGFALDSLNFPDQVASGAGDNITTVFGARYIGNISANSESGSYDSTLTYTITATF